MTDRAVHTASVPPDGERAHGPTAARLRRLVSRLHPGRQAGVLVGLLVISAYLTITQEAFLTWDNMMNIVASNSVVVILAIGATFVVIAGGLDLSAAAATAAASMILGLTLNADWALPLALLATVAFGIAVGLINGLLIAKLKISFIVVTLGTLSIWSSFALVINQGETISVFSSSSFGPIGDFVNNEIGPFPILLVFDVAIAALGAAVLRYTTFGRALFAVGSNPDAARLSGISIARVLVGVYVVAGIAVALGSVVQVGRLAAGSPTQDPTLLLTVLAAVFIGGTAATGGLGGVVGTLIGVIFLGVVQNGLTLSNVSTFWQGTVSGVILIGAVGLGVLDEHQAAIRIRRSARARQRRHL